MNKLNLLVVFTFGISLKKWQDNGSLKREIQPYIFLANNGFKITLLTYGDNKDINIIENNNIDVIPIYTLYKRSKYTVVNILKSLFIEKHINIQKFDVIKTNQVWGAWVAVLLKMACKSKLVVRLGYEPYMNSLHDQNILKKILYKYNSLLAYKNSDKIIELIETIDLIG